MASVTRPRRSRLLLMHSWWRFSSIYALVLVISCPGRRADPETVEGLYLTKKSAGPEVHELKGDLTAVPALPVGFRSASLERQQPPPHGSPSSATTRRPFPQARFGGVDKGAGRKAFGNYLSKPHRQRDHRYQPPPKPHYFPPIDYGMINQQMNQQKLSMKTMNNLHGNADFFAKAKHSWKWVSPSPSPKSDGKNPQPFTDVLGHPTTTGAPGSASSTATTMSVNPSKPPSPGVKNLNQLNDGQPPDLKHPPPSPSAVTSTSSSTSIANASSSEPIEANIDKKNHLPRVGFLRSPVVGAGAGGHVNSFTVEGSTGRQAVLGVILGVAFIAVFVGSGVALLAQCAADRGIFFGQRRMSGSNEEDARSFSSSSPPPSAADATPPELSLGGGHPTFVQPPAKGGGGGTAGGGGNRQHFFTGKLVLHEAGLAGPVSAVSQITSSLCAAQAAVMMPSPAEKITHDLVSPKTDEEEEEEESEEENSDDTVYECPGLASAGEEMVVSNPFFLQGRDLPHLESSAEPQPISQSSIFHHGIKGFN